MKVTTLGLHPTRSARPVRVPASHLGSWALIAALILGGSVTALAQQGGEKLSRRDRIALLNCGIIDDVAVMKEAAAPELDIYGVRNGDTIADIGFGWAWLEGLLMLTMDSLTIYANDVDKQALANIDRVIRFYLDLRDTPHSNQLIVVKGSKHTTNLPSATFSKVIVRETFHHFADPDAMLADLKRIMKPDGRIFLTEPLVDHTGISPYCGAPNYSRGDMEAFIERAGLRLITFHDLSHLPPYSVPWDAFEDPNSPPLVVYELGR